MTERRFRDLSLAVWFLLCGLILAPAASQAAGGFPSAFIVAGVPVDATAQDAVAAREAARAEGERVAFRRLLERLTAKSDWARLPMPGTQEIAALLLDFEVAGERNSGIRYLATYTYRFSPVGVRRLLKAAEIPFSELASKPVVLVPVLDTGDAVRLWDDPNPWRAAWNQVPSGAGLVPVIVPSGDLADVQALDAAAARSPKPEQLTALAQRHGNDDVAIVTATPHDGSPATLDISVSRYSPDGTPDTSTTEVSGPKLEPALYEAGVQAAMKELEEGWKKLTLSAGGGGQDMIIEISVPIKAAADWAAVRERLGKVPLVRASELELMSHDEVRLKLKIRGTDDLFKVALAQEDLVLTPAQPPGQPLAMLQLRSQAAGG
jgi:Uncharacterized protein conserved in bacteria (DUF2066)